MDKAYDGLALRAHSEALGHWALTELPQRHRRLKEKCRPARIHAPKQIMVRSEPIHRELTPAEQNRMHERTMVERVYSRLKDQFGARFIRLRGASEIMAHFGVLALSVDSINCSS